jgi:hypothetical protein
MLGRAVFILTADLDALVRPVEKCSTALPGFSSSEIEEFTVEGLWQPTAGLAFQSTRANRASGINR